MKATFNNFCKENETYAKIARKVINQAGVSAADAPSYLSNIRNAADGYTGFIYYRETEEFFKKNRPLIMDLLKMYADDFGESVVDVVKGFQCLKGEENIEDRIGKTLYGTAKQHDTTIANALAWFALEKVANRFNDFAYECKQND